MADPGSDAGLPAFLREARYQRRSIYQAADWYDVDYAGYRAEEPFYRLVCKPFLGSPVAELGAGTGRLTLPLAQDGHHVLAVEPAAGMRERLLSKLQQRVVAGSVTVTDGSAHAFAAAPGSLDVVLFPFNGVLHLADHDALHAAFHFIHSRLGPRGRFAFDVTSPYWDTIVQGCVPWGRCDERVHPTTGQKVFTCDRSRFDGATHTMHIDIRYLVQGADEGVEVELVQRMWTWQQLLWALDQCGFRTELLFGDVDLSPFSEGGVRMLISAFKR